MSTTVPTLRKTAAQLDGLACIDCGADTTEQQPTGDRGPDDVQLFACTDPDVCRAQRSVNAQFPALAALRAVTQRPAADTTDIEIVAAAPTYTLLAEQVADRLAAEMPKFAAKMDRAVFVAHVAAGLRSVAHPLCPDGRLWCTADPASHADPREHIHRGPEISMNGAYGFDVMAFHLLQWNDDEVELAFVGAGDWPDLSLDQVDELISDMAVHLDRLRAMRAQMGALQDARVCTAATLGRETSR
ncbi:DUF6907 domain-containing protein [Streptomyces sp. S584]|uniref:DUF6907 domain-containing protein n=1 Tax=Streptomyces sp. S584 TaxID=3096010 RepID=UPI002B003AD7|nr:hypothetical protein [Streptomyces sp. S584]